MNGQLSHQLPQLHTEGRSIVNAAGQPVRLRGVNRSGLEYVVPGASGFLAAASFTQEEVRAITRGWGANIVRLPFNQEFVLRGSGSFTGEQYCQALDQVIAWCAAEGAYTLLDLQWLDAVTPHGANPDGSINRVPALPNRESPRLWTFLAERYRDEPAVLFDLLNEPHSPIADDADLDRLEGIAPDGSFFPLPGREVGMREWKPWARLLAHTVREVHPQALLFVSGVQWAYQLWGMPLTVAEGSREPFPNMVYSTHVYANKGPRRPRRAAPEEVPFLPDTPQAPNWHTSFGALAAEFPVFAGEWGGGEEDLEWGRALARYFDFLQIGWTAWSWTDWPHLIDRTAAAPFTPTVFGSLVRDALRVGTRPS